MSSECVRRLARYGSMTTSDVCSVLFLVPLFYYAAKLHVRSLNHSQGMRFFPDKKRHHHEKVEDDDKKPAEGKRLSRRLLTVYGLISFSYALAPDLPLTSQPKICWRDVVQQLCAQVCGLSHASDCKVVQAHSRCVIQKYWHCCEANTLILVNSDD